jgi:hypothetical protein
MNRSSWPVYFFIYLKHSELFSVLGFLDIFESLDKMVNSCISDRGEFYNNEEISMQLVPYGVTVEMLNDFVTYYIDKAVISSKNHSKLVKSDFY